MVFGFSNHYSCFLIFNIQFTARDAIQYGKNFHNIGDERHDLCWSSPDYNQLWLLQFSQRMDSGEINLRAFQ